MSIDPITAALELGESVINKIWPNAKDRAIELRKLQEVAQKGDLAAINAQVQITLSQLNINKEEAQHKSLFVAGARPFILWIGGFSLGWAGIFHPILMWLWAFYGIDVSPPPVIDSTALNAIVAGLLGVGSFRSIDKYNKVQTDKI
jgi:hypothetical protein